MNDGELKPDSSEKGSEILAELHKLRWQLGICSWSEGSVAKEQSTVGAYLATPASRMLLIGSLAIIVAMQVVAFSVLVFMVDRLHTRVAYAESHLIQMRHDLDEIYRLQTQLQQSRVSSPRGQTPPSTATQSLKRKEQ